MKTAFATTNADSRETSDKNVLNYLVLSRISLKLAVR